ncbi:hypothetical protein [Pseudoponticoccus marisrubri]|uniref:Alpha/beta hydrolase n=1 Tax=Pseudoponticoccus marisrubri TaxID=1685382 RepID=A0A0W7WEJ2_9RHOB|nr:hypothetical protein [Pseudoponticoccus marisrubri]KUF08985.1 hypothetical protein AVJ23_20055 [Pseudoponticoccus marisrubri]
MSLPSQAGKVSLERLQGIPKIEWDGQATLSQTEKTVLSFDDSGFRFDFLWSPKPGAKRLFVLFSGDAIRAKNDPPVFQRWSWADYFPGHCLYISDPALYMDKELGLAWYAGTEDFDPMPVVRDRLNTILNNLGLPQSAMVSYGSSGGGFAALRLLRFMPDVTAVSVNPQVSITDYEMRRKVNIFLRICFGGRARKEALAEFPERLNLLSDPEPLKSCNIILVQNVLDSHHYEDHYKPFCAALEVGDDHAPDDPALHRVLFENPGGHTKAEDAATFGKIISIIERGA